MKQNQIEQFYDYYDEIADLLYRNYKVPYLEGMNEAFHLLLDDTLLGSYSTEDVQTMRQAKEAIIAIPFEREDIRKSVQLGMLKAFKHTNASNSLITPDSIGIFLAYLIKKFHPTKTIGSLFDPLLGSGNLVYTIANQLDATPEVFGVDQDHLMCQIARNLGDLLEYENHVFFQDTFTFYNTGFDVLVTDMPIENEGPYLPYQVLNHHIDSVKPGGFVFALIENDFFEQDGSDTFREEIAKKGQIIGLLALPSDLFTTHPKSIFILRRHHDNPHPMDGFLLVELPSFRDEDGMTKILYQIDQWIAQRKDDLR